MFLNTGKMVQVSDAFGRVSPADQLEAFRHWHIHEWRLTNRHYDAAKAGIARLPNIIPRGAVIQLVPYLPRSEEDGLIPLQYTCAFLWARAKGQYSEYHCEVDIDNFKSVTMAPGTEYKEGVRWEVIDLTANECARPADVCVGRPFPGVGILAVAALQPEAFKKIGKTVVLSSCRYKSVFDLIHERHNSLVASERAFIGSALTLRYVSDDPGIDLSYLPLLTDPAEEARRRPGFSWVIPSFVRV